MQQKVYHKLRIDNIDGAIEEVNELLDRLIQEKQISVKYVTDWLLDDKGYYILFIAEFVSIEDIVEEISGIYQDQIFEISYVHEKNLFYGKKSYRVGGMIARVEMTSYILQELKEELNIPKEDFRDGNYY